MKTSKSIKEQLSGAESIKLVTDWLVANKSATRTDLARHVCQNLNFRDAKDRLRLSTTLKALRDSERQGYWKLPEPVRKKTRRVWNPRRLDAAVERPREVPQQADEIEGLELIEVRTEDGGHLRIWNELMLSEHPLKDARLVGRQLRYLIGSAHGWLGGIGFGSSALYLSSRDDWIGWNEAQRTEYNSRIINMTRFLIRDSVNCKNLASHVLGLCGKRVGTEFKRRYGYEPWLMESFVDSNLYQGTCYQAGNWICVGQTKGRGRNGGNKAAKSKKDVYMYPLVQNFRVRMGVNKAREISALPLDEGLESAQWAEQEFGGCYLGDKRLQERLVKIAEAKGKQPDSSYAQACQGDRHALKGYYRLINNTREEVSSEAILKGHREQTIRRMKNEKTVLVIQDTMDLNFSTRQHCEGLGLVGKNQTGAESMGLKVHSALVVNPKGLPLGVLRVNTYAPEATEGKKKATRPIEEKESYRWLQTYQDALEVSEKIPKTHIVCVGDRESDIFELFDTRRCRGSRVDLLVRAKHNRCLDESDKKLFDQLESGPVKAEVSIQVPRQREKKGKPSKPGRKALPARTAKVEVRFQKVSICAPNTPQTKGKKSIGLFAIHLLEKQPPPGATRIKWVLLTTIEIHSLKQAMKCVRWYGLRWRIEEWHRILKSGCGVLEHQNHTAETLSRAIALDAVNGWRIMLLTLLGREVPELPASILFDTWECEVLDLLSQKKSLYPSVRQCAL